MLSYERNVVFVTRYKPSRCLLHSTPTPTSSGDHIQQIVNSIGCLLIHFQHNILGHLRKFTSQGMTFHKLSIPQFDCWSIFLILHFFVYQIWYSISRFSNIRNLSFWHSTKSKGVEFMHFHVFFDLSTKFIKKIAFQFTGGQSFPFFRRAGFHPIWVTTSNKSNFPFFGSVENVSYYSLVVFICRIVFQIFDLQPPHVEFLKSFVKCKILRFCSFDVFCVAIFFKISICGRSKSWFSIFLWGQIVCSLLICGDFVALFSNFSTSGRCTSNFQIFCGVTIVCFHVCVLCFVEFFSIFRFAAATSRICPLFL